MTVTLARGIVGDFLLEKFSARVKLRFMKTPEVACLFLLLSAFCTKAVARENAPHYKFSDRATNVFSVQISLRNDLGSEVITGKVFLVTREAATNSAKISCWSLLNSEIREAPRNLGSFPAYTPAPMIQRITAFPNDCVIELGDQGVELRDGGDFLLAVPLGKLVQSLYEPLPEKFDGKGAVDTAMVLDEPFWLGPAENFFNYSVNTPRLGARPYQSYGQAPLATWRVSRNVATRLKSSTANTVAWHKHTAISSFSLHGREPVLTASSESDFVFDRNSGLLAEVETEGEFSVQTQNFLRRAKVSFKSHLLTGAELAAALTPSPAFGAANRAVIQRHKLTAADLETIASELRSSDVEIRRAAMQKLNFAEMEKPSSELVHVVGDVEMENDPNTSGTAAYFLGLYATSNEIPVLLKMLKDTKGNARYNAAQALGRVKVPQAAPILADWIAREGTVDTQEAIPALVNIGAPAEKAVLALLGEHNAETLRIACNILQQIGTAESLDALQKLVGDSNQSISQVAAEAIRTIKLRQ